MIEFATEISEDSILNKKEAEPKKKKSIEDTIFEFFFILYYHHNCKEKSLVKQKLKLAIEATIWCLQMVSLLWIPNLLISDWEANMTMWVAIGYVKIDNTCSAFDIEDKCLYISMAYDFIVILGIFACFLAIYFSKSLPKIIISLLNRLIWLWLNFLCIPSLEIFTLFLKYSSQQKNVTEYKKNEDSAKYEISSPIQTLSIIAILICFLTILLYSILSSEIRHCAAKSTVNAKAHSKIEIHTAIFTFSFPVFYSIFADNYILHLQILALIISVFLIAETISFFPYFSEYCSIVVIIRFFIVALVSFLFIFGYCLDNSLSISIFAIILLPISIIFIIIYTLKLHKKLSKNIPESIDGIHDQYHLEKSLRYALCSENHKNKDEIIRIFENFFLFKGLHRCKLQIIWIANYCLFTLKNGALAKIKLSKAKSLSEWSLEARYQEYLCNRIITEFDSNESVSYENYYHKINQIKHQDRKLCENLSSFWEEVTSKNLSFYNLIRTLNSIDDGIEFLNAEYKQLTTKYHNSRDALIMYFLYMRNILHDYDNSDKINYKLRFFDRIFSSITNNTQNLSCFNSSNGILLISNEDENFGEILSANSKAMSFFNLSLHDIIGNNIQSFIPEPYKTKILDKMNHMVHFSSTTDTYFNDGCFFISKKNYLLETIGKASITSINSVLVTILVFKINRTQHQAALVSEEGEIYCYSEGFSEIAGNCNNLAGLNIKSLFPCLEKTELQPLTPYHIPGLKSETILIFMHSEFYSIKIPYVLLINDPNEIIKWKDENWRTQYDFSSENSVRPTPFSFQMLKSSVSEENSPLLSKEALGHDYLSDETTKIIKEKNNTEKSQSTESSSQCVFLQMIKISSRSIDVLHLILVLLVTFNQICVVIFTNLAVLFYAFNRINAVRDLSLPKALGDIGKSFQQIGLLSRLIFIFYPLSQAASIVNFCFSRFEENVKNLDNLYTNISGNLTNWGSCSGNDIFSENNINLWKIDDDIYKEKTNLIDTISQFIQFGNEFMRKFKNSENYSKETSFFVLNGYGEAFEYSYNSLYDVISCQKSAILNFKTEIFSLLLLGVLLLSLGIFIMAPFCYAVIKTENILWNNTRKFAYKYYKDLKQSCLSRLSNIHSQPETEANSQPRSNKPLIFKSYWKYIWRIGLFSLTTSIFCIINITYFYEKCAEYVYNRPEVTEALINSQVLFTTLSTWTTEAGMKNSIFSLSKQLTYGCPFGDPENNLEDVIFRIKKSQKAFRDSKYSSILPESFKKPFFEYDGDCEVDVHRYGIHAGGELSILDAYLIAQFEGNSMNEWLPLMYSLQELDGDYNIFIKEYNQYSQNVIDDEMNIIIGVLAIYIITSIIMYLSLYLVFFRSEKKYLMKINSMLQIMPEKVIAKQNDL